MDLRHPYAEDSQKLIESAKALFAAMDDTLYLLEVNQTNVQKGLTVQRPEPEELLNADEAQKELTRQATHDAIYGVAVLNGMLSSLQAKADEIKQACSGVIELLTLTGEEVYKMAAPLHIEALMKEQGMSWEEAVAVLEGPIPAEKMAMLQEGILNITRNSRS